MNRYRVGFKKPPKDTQFKKGTSGNPKGRPKHSARNSLAELIKDSLNRKRKVTVNGKIVSMTMRELVAEAVVTGAMKGQNRYLKLLLELEKPKAGDLARGRKQILDDIMKELTTDIEPRKKRKVED